MKQEGQEGHWKQMMRTKRKRKKEEEQRICWVEERTKSARGEEGSRARGAAKDGKQGSIMQSHQKRGIQKSRTGIKRARESYRDR